MHTNNANKGKILHPELSYKLTGLFYKIHNELGRFGRERQYADAVENTLIKNKINFYREKELPVEIIDNHSTNKVDFDIESEILVDIKAKRFITKEDYYQMQRYLHAANYKLGLIVNFRNSYLKPVRIIRLNS
jgi:GxxExxY protein